ncbi:hypothetical protein [Natrialba asiatica]|uniref:Uncharacterized protein n=1 Tax=Natrialba asiatica (strain ATCC 700177 / DSM 12278 / JCM 9576 / FERM P-10747 / NBRC 102637 / 172P1) TaxID=29540 RepID=M0APG9_NATA1|nr:hypothetical protein [Natrialba asiatica]ELZ00425.1 hypothetical protein C481_12284 [Natrialba asiatica DSM 12278]
MSTPNDSNDGTPTGTEPSQQTADNAPVGLIGLVRITIVLLRARPSLLVPFALAGAVGATSAVARIESPYPVDMVAFPANGVVHLSVALVPALEPMAEVNSGLVLGLKPAFLAVLIGWQVGLALAVTVAFAGVVRLATRSISKTDAISSTSATSEVGADGSRGLIPGLVPSPARLGWLFAYVLGVQIVLLAGLFVVGAFGIGPGPGPRSTGLGLLFGWLFVVVPIASGLFLTPAAIVIGGKRPIEAVIESGAYAVRRPFSVVALLLATGYLGTVLTGVFHGGPSPRIGVALGTFTSVAVGGTLHATVVAAAYVCWSADD